MALQFWLDVLLAILLALTIGYCAVLQRKLNALRAAQNTFAGLLGDFDGASEKANQSVGALRAAAVDIAAELDQKLALARGLSDELGLMTDSGTALADRLEVSLLATRPGTGASGGSASGIAMTDDRERQSESELELLKTLGRER